jgi:N-acetyl-anhydromuramyl-L-alanine amidase AmpD
VVDHFTGGVRASDTLRWFSARPRAAGVGNSSAHVVIARDGAIIALIDPITTIAWHARAESYTHVGIEHVNAGLLRKEGEEFFFQNTRKYVALRVPQLQEVEPDKFWEPYTPKQVVSNIILKRWLIAALPGMMKREHFVDHQQIDPTRKIDCGPLWPLQEINDLVFSGEALAGMPWLQKEVLTKDDVANFGASTSSLSASIVVI